MRAYKRIMSYALVLVAILSFVAVPVKASESVTLPPGWGRSTFWDHGKGGGFGERFSTEQDYNDYVEELPASEIGDDGSIYWHVAFSDFDLDNHQVKYQNTNISGFDGEETLSYGRNVKFFADYDNNQIEFSVSSSQGDTWFYMGPDNMWVFPPVNGSYKRVQSDKLYTSYMTSGGTTYVSNQSWAEEADYQLRSAGASFEISGIGDLTPEMASIATGYIYFPVYSVIPTSGLIDVKNDTTYNVNTRAGSITGDYGVLGDNNTITKSDTTYIVSEDDNSVYNPVTNTTTTYDSWTYDYADRSYNFTTQEGDTTTVTYGDENVTIKEGDTTYTVYYIYQTGSGDDTGSGGGSGSGSNSGIFGKLGDLIGTVLGGILSMLEAIVGKLLDALTSLAEMISDKLAKIVEMVLGWFDEIPKMFSGFLDLLAAIFPFIPPELMMLLSFGLAAVLFIGIVKAIRR